MRCQRGELTIDDDRDIPPNGCFFNRPCMSSSIANQVVYSGSFSAASTMVGLLKSNPSPGTGQVPLRKVGASGKRTPSTYRRIRSAWVGIVGVVDDMEDASRAVVPRAISIHPYALHLRYIPELQVAPAPGHQLTEDVCMMGVGPWWPERAPRTDDDAETEFCSSRRLPG